MFSAFWWKSVLCILFHTGIMQPHLGWATLSLCARTLDGKSCGFDRLTTSLPIWSLSASLWSLNESSSDYNFTPVFFINWLESTEMVITWLAHCHRHECLLIKKHSISNHMTMGCCHCCEFKYWSQSWFVLQHCNFKQLLSKALGKWGLSIPISEDYSIERK